MKIRKIHVILGVIVLFVLCGVIANVAEDDRAISPIIESAESDDLVFDDSCVNAEELSYIRHLAIGTETIGSSSGDLADLFDKASTNPALILDQDWKASVQTLISRIRVVAENILDLQAPTSVSSISDPANAMAQSFLISMERYAHGIDNLDVKLIEDGISAMSIGTEYMSRMGRASEVFVMDRKASVACAE